jgi:aspartate/methionine/tyrosine aminotransferase
VAAREALAARFGGSPEDYWLTASTSEAYSWVFAATTDPGDVVAVPAPGYPLVEPLARLADLRTTDCRWHYLEPDGWCADPLGIDHAARLGARLFIVINPGNPTGAYVDSGTTGQISRACLDTGSGLIADEVFNPFGLEGTPSSLAGQPGTLTFAFNGLSKLLCAPQLKLSWIRLSGPPREQAPIRAALDQIADTFLPVNAPVALALPELLELSDAVLAVTRQRLATNLATSRHLFEQPRYRVRRCEAGWSMILDLPRNSGNDEPTLPDSPDGPPDPPDIAVRLLRQAGLAVHPGWFYDIGGRETLVLSLLPPPDQFEDQCRQLIAAL